MPEIYMLSDQAWAKIDPLLPKIYAGARRKDDRLVISGIVHVLRSGCRWQDCPWAYGPHTTVYNRFNRWSRRGFPLCQTSCCLNRIGTFGGADSRKSLDTDKRTKIG